MQAAAASAMVTSCRTSCNQISYFCDVDKKRFARRCLAPRPLCSKLDFGHDQILRERSGGLIKTQISDTKSGATHRPTETLRAEITQIRSHWNGVRLHEGIGYVTPDDEHEGRGAAIRAARRTWLDQSRRRRLAWHRLGAGTALRARCQLTVTVMVLLTPAALLFVVEVRTLNRKARCAERQ